MKKILLILSAIAFGVSGANADVTLRNVMNNIHSLSKLPAKYTIDNKDRLVNVPYEDDGTTIQIFDDDFNIAKEIHTVGYSVSAKYTVWEEKYSVTDARQIYENSYKLFQDCTLADAKNAYGLTNEKEIDGKIHLYREGDSGEYFGYQYFGDKYPQADYYFEPNGQYNESNEALGTLYVVYYEYEYVYDYTGEWEVQGEYENTNYSDLIHLEDEFDEVDCIYLTQNLFNNDEKYEYIIPNKEVVDIDRIEDHYHVTGQTIRTTGYRIMSEDGTILSTIKYPNGYFDGGNGMSHAVLNNKNYLLCSVNDKDYNDYYLVYEIDPSSNSVKSVGAPIKTSVHPTAPARGETVNIDLSDVAAQGATVSVTSVSGKTVMSEKIAGGTNHASIDTSSLQRGVYVVTVNNGKTTRENTKIIIR
jgi:hypothetical protein